MFNLPGASMTLAGLVPPLCGDSGGMLVDGGYSKNFTALQIIISPTLLVDNLPVNRRQSVDFRF